MTTAEPDILALEVLIRRDGVGEIREGDSVERIIAADADELRNEIMTRVVDRATREQLVIDLRTIDIDGVFPLRVSPDGSLIETGNVGELAPGEDELTDRLKLGGTEGDSPAGDNNEPQGGAPGVASRMSTAATGPRSERTATASSRRAMCTRPSASLESR